MEGLGSLTSPLTGGKRAKQTTFRSAYQLANIQIFCTGTEGTSISNDHIWMWSMDFSFSGGKYLKRSRNDK